MSSKGARWFGRNPPSSRFICSLTPLVCVTAFACSESHSIESEARTTSALIGGSLSPVERDAVVFIRANHEDGKFDDCTGTLVSPHVVITAKHCVTLVQTGSFICTGAGTLKVDGLGAGSFGAKIDGARIEIFPGTAPVGTAAAHVLASFVTDSGDACHDDVAALVLDAPIQQDSYPPLRSTRATVIGEYVRLVGYGTTAHESLIERHELANVRIIDVGRDDGAPNPAATTPARSFVVGGATACFGDSGGPALSMETGALTGVYSRITGDCFAAESRNTFMLASSFSELFARAFSLAGEQPTLEEVPTVPLGAAGSGGAANSAGGSSTTTVDAAGSAGISDETGGSGGMDDDSGGALGEPSVPTRHEALHCSLGQPGVGIAPVRAVWVLLALLVGFSRRRFDRCSS